MSLIRDKAGRIVVSQQFSDTHYYRVCSSRTGMFSQFSSLACAAMTVVMRCTEDETEEWYVEDHLGRRWPYLACRGVLAQSIPEDDKEFYMSQGMLGSRNERMRAAE